jgi:hypothetical protein
MSKDRKSRDRVEAVLTQLQQDLATVRFVIEELQDEGYRRALRWSGNADWRQADSELNGTLRRLAWNLERMKHFIGIGGWDLDALVPMPGRVSRTRLSFASWAMSAYWAVWYHRQDAEGLIRTVKRCASRFTLSQMSVKILTNLSASMAINILVYNDI